MEKDACATGNYLQAVETLKELIRIKSEAGNPAVTSDGQRLPFGRGVQDSFAYILNKAQAMGFSTLDVDHYGGHVEFGQGKKILGIPAHLDVVPAAGSWDFDPYGGEEIDGCICGRGAIDDKGPLVAVLYAMKSLKDSGYEPKCRIRLILGLDEETDWEGMRYYLKRQGLPNFGFVPDGRFPVVNGEKGRLIFQIAKKLGRDPASGLVLSKLSGGSAPNIVAEHARAVLRSGDRKVYDGIREQLSAFGEETGYRLKARGTGKSLEITASGMAAHAAKAQEGISAIGILMAFLGRLNLVNDDIRDFIRFYNEHIGLTSYGEGLEIECSDEKSGCLTVNNGMIDYDRNSVRILMDIRYPVSMNGDWIYEKIEPLIEEEDLGIVKMTDQVPIYVEADDPTIRTLVEVYREHTGDEEHALEVSGGGSYAKLCPGLVCFGGVFPEEADLMHRRNERIGIDRFCQLIDIYEDAIRRLSEQGAADDLEEEQHEDGSHSR